MKLPAPLVKAWGDIQLNFDAVAREVTPFVYAVTFATGGAWGTVVPPSSTVGVPFTLPRAGPTLIQCDITGYSTTGGGISVQVYLDGVLEGTATLAPVSPSNVHVALRPVKIAKTLTRGTHWLWYRQTVGVSDTADDSSISVIQP